MRGMNKNLAAFVGATLFGLSSVSANAVLPPESTSAVQPLSADYPDSMVFIHDANFDSLVAGRVILLDVGLESRHYKGALDAAQFASFLPSRQRSELYVAETFYSRGTRGERTDVISIYAKEGLQRIGEISLPGGKRGQYVSHRYTLQLIDDDKYLLVYNFTPAASVTVIDIAKREILSETQIPGCALIYPTGKRGFTSLCSNGSLFTAQFDEQGKLTRQEKLTPFFDVDDDPLFDKPVYVGNTAWFPSFKGDIQAIDMGGELPVIGERWSLLNAVDKAENWRPGGWQIASASDGGHIYMLMHKDGVDGSHKSGGTEVWVYDPRSKKRLHRFKLKNHGVSIEVSRGDKPYLVVTTVDAQVDVYDAANGSWKKVIGGTANTPFNIHSMR